MQLPRANYDGAANGWATPTTIRVSDLGASKSTVGCDLRFVEEGADADD
jgi:hypothetical protein